MSTDYSKFDAESGEQVHTATGAEIPDPTPMAPPVGYVRQPSLAEQMRDMIRSEAWRRQMEESGNESFEEADDFDVDDDFDPSTPYEADFDPMSDADKAALSSRGRNVDGILGPAPAPSPAPKPKKQTGSTVQVDPPLSEQSDDPAAS